MGRVHQLLLLPPFPISACLDLLPNCTLLFHLEEERHSYLASIVCNSGIDILSFSVHSKNVPDKYKVYEILLDLEDDPSDNIPSG